MKQEVGEIHNLFPEEENPIDENRIVYHYTNYDALKSILSNKCIWLTKFQQSNDSTEGRLLFDKAFKQLELHNKNEIKTKLNKLFVAIMKNTYVSSFCRYGNKLSQWRYYGNVNIGFDFKQLSSSIHIIEDKNKEERYTSGLFFNECDYLDPSDLLSLNNYISEFLNTFSDIRNVNLDDLDIFRYNALTLGLVLFPIKHKGFSEEAEYRAVHYFWDVIPFNNPCKDKLYIKLLFNESVIKRIVIGPSTEQDLIREKVISFLEENNTMYGNIDIVNSKIPFIENN